MNFKEYSLIAIMAFMPIMLFSLTEEVISEEPAPHGVQLFPGEDVSYTPIYPIDRQPSAPPRSQIQGGRTAVPEEVIAESHIDFKLIFQLCKKKIRQEVDTAGSRFRAYITGRQAIVGGIFYSSIALSTVYLYSKARSLFR